MKNKLLNLLIIGLLVFLATPVFSASCPTISGSTNCGNKFFCGGKCLSAEELKNTIGNCNNFNCGSCSCSDGFSLPHTPAYLNVDNNVGYLKLLDFLMIYKDSGNNAELKLQSTETENTHWGIYHDRGSQDLRFWNAQAGNNLTLSTNGNIVFGGEKDLDGKYNGMVGFLKDALFLGKSLTVSGGKINIGPGFGSIYYSTSTLGAIISGGNGPTDDFLATLGKNNGGIDFFKKSRFFGDVYVGVSGMGNNLYVNDGEISGKWIHATSLDGESTFANKVNIYNQLNVFPENNMPIASFGGSATGNRSIAMIGGVGGGSVASGDYSFSAGASAQALGDYSVALGGAYGNGTKATGNGSFAAGGSAVADGTGAVAIGGAYGNGTKATGDGAFAGGGMATVNGYGSVALGEGEVIGSRSFAFNSKVSGDQSIGLGLVIGSGTIINGSNSILIGNGTLNKSNVTVINSPSGLVGINNFDPTSALDVSGHIKSNSLEVASFMKFNSASRGACNQTSVGRIIYEEVNNVGNFYGCVRTSVNNYTWKQLDN